MNTKYIFCGEPHNSTVCTNKDSPFKFVNCKGLHPLSQKNVEKNAQIPSQNRS